ncbi:MAG: hypothetical protein JSS61_01750 [Verrucomicrobia bacterium]|nr:hypothetical protein [Verrucomicrobiota bacterium]
MAALPAKPSKEPSGIVRKALKLKGNIDGWISKMHKNENLIPSRDQLGEIAKSILEFHNAHHAALKSLDSYLKKAVIDLTEVPAMVPALERVAFLTALKDASKQLELFIEHA